MGDDKNIQHDAHRSPSTESRAPPETGSTVSGSNKNANDVLKECDIFVDIEDAYLDRLKRSEVIYSIRRPQQLANTTSRRTTHHHDVLESARLIEQARGLITAKKPTSTVTSSTGFQTSCGGDPIEDFQLQLNDTQLDELFKVSESDLAIINGHNRQWNVASIASDNKQPHGGEHLIQEEILRDIGQSIQSVGSPSPEPEDLTCFLNEDDDLLANIISPEKMDDISSIFSGDTMQTIKQLEPHSEAGTSAGPTELRPYPPLHGFSTGHGSRISVAKTALSKCSSIFDGEQLNDVSWPMESIESNFKRPYQVVSPNDISKLDVHELLPCSNEPPCKLPKSALPIRPIPAVCTLTTGRGAEIRVSKDSQRRANIFDDFDMSLASIIADDCTLNGFSTGQGVNFQPINTCVPSPQITTAQATSLHTPINAKSLSPSLAHEIMDSTKALLKDETLNADSPFENASRAKSRYMHSIKPTRLVSRFHECMQNNELIVEVPCSVSNEVKVYRAKIRSDQQRAILEKNAIQKQQGALYQTKLMSKQMSWPDFVHNQKPSIAPSEALNLSPENVQKFKFNVNPDLHTMQLADDMHVIPDDRNQVGIAEMSSAFLSCNAVDPKLLHAKWLTHHLSLILLKLSAIERSFPERLGDERTLNVANVMLQIKYRYDKEIDRAERSILRKVLEKDEVASRRMVLYVARIWSDSECELSDGHYGVRTALDAEMQRVFRANLVQVGTKLMISGAEVIGLGDGGFPLDIPSTVHLRISSNSTRRVRWFTKLGMCRNPAPFAITLGSVQANGGRISRLNLCILRIYSMVFVDKTKQEGGRMVLQSERVHNRLEMENVEQELIEKMYSQVTNEYDQQQEASRSNQQSINRITDLTSASQIYDILNTTNDPDTVEDQMTPTQKRDVRTYHAKQLDIRAHAINEQVRDRVASCTTRRKVSRLLKLKVIDAGHPNTTAMLSVWNPHESLVDMLHERQFVQLCNASASGTKHNELQITVGKTSRLTRLPDPTGFVCDQFRQVTSIGAMNQPNFRPRFDELDIVGLVVKIGHYNSRKFESVFVVDAAMNLMCIHFWNGLHRFAYDDLITVGKVLAVRDLQWRTLCSVQKTIPSTFATEHTTFTEHPKSTEMAHALVALNKSVGQLGKQCIIEESLVKIACLMATTPKSSATNFSPKTPNFTNGSKTHPLSFMDESPS